MKDHLPDVVRSRVGEHPLVAAARAFAGRMVYGAIIILAAILALDAGKVQTAGDVTLLIVLATMAVAFAEVYADLVGETIRQRRALDRAEVWRLAVNLCSIFLTPIPPLALVGLSSLGVMKLRTAVVASAWLLVGLLFLFGYVAFREAGRSRLRSVLGAAILLGAGLVMVGLKFIVTH